MKITITGRKVNLRDSFKERVEKKLRKFDKFFGDEADANVTVTVLKNSQTVEITIKDSGFIYRSEETAPQMEDALDKVIDKITRQIRKNKTRLEKKLRVSDFSVFDEDDDGEVEEETAYNIVKSKHFTVKPMDVEEAILQMNMLGHVFYMFRNMDTNEINVVYRRKDGDYGLLEAE